jgi:uncharacterized integral membrane protein
MSDRPHRGAAPLPGQKPSKERSWRFYAAIVIAAIALLFIIQNSQKVEFRFFFVEGQTPLFFGLIIALLLGALVGWLLPRVRGNRRHEERERD